MPPVKILIAEPLDFCPRAVEILRAAGQVELRDLPKDGFSQALDEYDVIWFRLATKLDAELIAGAKRCKFLAVPATGTDHIDHAACKEHGIEILSLVGEVEFLRTIRGTAELTIALILGLLRMIPGASASVLAGQWNRDRFRGCEIYGKTVGIVGVGRLGTLVAGYLKAFGANVIGYDPRPDYPHHVAERRETLLELMAASDMVSVHAVLNDSTVGLIGASELEAMKPGGVLINTSRGRIVDQGALLESLRNGHLAGAALDVLTGEPQITASHPLVAYAQQHDNLLIVPHIGGNTYESFQRTEIFLAEKLVKRLAQVR